MSKYHVRFIDEGGNVIASAKMDVIPQSYSFVTLSKRLYWVHCVNYYIDTKDKFFSYKRWTLIQIDVFLNEHKQKEPSND